MLKALSTTFKTSYVIVIIFMAISFNNTAYAQQKQQQSYPRVTGYFSIINPIGAWNKNGFTINFKDVYTVGVSVRNEYFEE